MRLALIALGVSCLAWSACRRSTPPDPAKTGAPSASAAPSARERAKAFERSGNAIARGVTESALFIADEDRNQILAAKIPVEASARPVETKLPGPPAAVVALADKILVTVRNPGLLLGFRADPEKLSLTETMRVELPADAWGIGVSPDEKTAIVTSAWTHQVSAIDLESGKLRFSLDVAREPRGVVVFADRAYVSHLVGSALTRIDGLAGPGSQKSIDLPAAPLRTPYGKNLNASLGYALAASPNEDRLFAARQALGAVGPAAWSGSLAIDALVTASDTPLVAPRQAPPHVMLSTLGKTLGSNNPYGANLVDQDYGALPMSAASPVVQPRALVYRKSTRTLLVAGEGNDSITELDALSLAPDAKPLQVYKVGAKYDAVMPVASQCGAPSGIALSSDEALAFVWCRATGDLAIVTLARHDGTEHVAAPVPVMHFADDPLPKEAALGRRLFFNSTDENTSGGLGCAGCHPDGRDDGHVWHEIETKPDATFIAEAWQLRPSKMADDQKDLKGFARQTPMIAGRVSAKGPYGWHGESATLPDRVIRGIKLHRWEPREDWGALAGPLAARAGHLSAFLRQGLAPPPRPTAALDAKQSRGKELFTNAEVGCSSCHLPDNEFTNRERHSMPPPNVRAGFQKDPDAQLRTPSLAFVAGTPPYFHDGRAKTLDDLVKQNDNRMGKTQHLSQADRDALVAYLKTL